MFGHNHSDETRQKMSDAKKAMYQTGANHPMFAKARPDGAGKPAIKTSVFDKNTKITIIYNSIVEAARALNISDITCRRYLVTGKPYKDRYIFSKVS
jgi:group I intron endonuclease